MYIRLNRKKPEIWDHLFSKVRRFIGSLNKAIQFIQKYKSIKCLHKMLVWKSLIASRQNEECIMHPSPSSVLYLLIIVYLHLFGLLIIFRAKRRKNIVLIWKKKVQRICIINWNLKLNLLSFFSQFFSLGCSVFSLY